LLNPATSSIGIGSIPSSSSLVEFDPSSSSKPGHPADPSDPAGKLSLSKPSMMIYPMASHHSLVVGTTSSQVTTSVSTAGA
jgi:hypothetical protein